jgi:Tfp pilus assembly protein PilE
MTQARPPVGRFCGFALIELPVVTAIIAVPADRLLSAAQGQN